MLQDIIQPGLTSRPIPIPSFQLSQEAGWEQGAPGALHPTPRDSPPPDPLPSHGPRWARTSGKSGCLVPSLPGLKNPINSRAAASGTTPPHRLRGDRFGSGLIPPPPLVLSFQFLPQTPECLGLHTREFTPREQSLISALCAGQGCFTPPSITLLDLIPSLMPLGRGL